MAHASMRFALFSLWLAGSLPSFTFPLSPPPFPDVKFYG